MASHHRANVAHIRQSRPDSGLDLSHFFGVDLLAEEAVDLALEHICERIWHM